MAWNVLCSFLPLVRPPHCNNNCLNIVAMLLNPTYLYVKAALCSRAFRLNEAILDPRHNSPPLGILHWMSCRDGEDEIGISLVPTNGCWKVCWVGGLACCWMDMLRCDLGMEVWCEYDCGRTSCPVCANGWCGGESGREGVVTGAIVGIAVPIVVGHRWSLWKVHRESPMGLGLYAWAMWDGRIGAGGRRIAAVFLRFFHFARRFWNHTC